MLFYLFCTVYTRSLQQMLNPSAQCIHDHLSKCYLYPFAFCFDDSIIAGIARRLFSGIQFRVATTLNSTSKDQKRYQGCQFVGAVFLDIGYFGYALLVSPSREAFPAYSPRVYLACFPRGMLFRAGRPCLFRPGESFHTDRSTLLPLRVLVFPRERFSMVYLA